MIMTNYMDLLAAEALVAAEFYALFLGEGKNAGWRKFEKQLGIFAGVYFAGVVTYLLTSVVPTLEWKGLLDQIAVISYLLGIIPLGGIALMELGILWQDVSSEKRAQKHFQLLIGFLVISHIAMIFGMVDPTLSGWSPEPVHMEMPVEHNHMMH